MLGGTSSETTRMRRYWVSSLVLMEDARRHLRGSKTFGVVEEGFKPCSDGRCSEASSSLFRHRLSWCFKPCSDGRCSEAFAQRRKLIEENSFKPCSDGRCSEAAALPCLSSIVPRVSSLVLMEDARRQKKVSKSNALNGRFKPCSDGRCSEACSSVPLLGLVRCFKPCSDGRCSEASKITKLIRAGALFQALF